MSLFGLSPSGVCHASFVASGPVVSYTATAAFAAVTALIFNYNNRGLGPPFHLRLVRKRGCLFSVALSVLLSFWKASLWITKHSALWSSDFPLPQARAIIS